MPPSAKDLAVPKSDGFFASAMKLWRRISLRVSEYPPSILLVNTYNGWKNDHAPRLGAALAFYSVLSLVPLLLLFLSIAGFFWGHEAAQGQIADQITSALGENAASVIRTVLTTASHERGAGIIASIISFLTLIFSASGMFGELQDSMNVIWKVKLDTKRSLLTLMREKAFSFLMVLGSGILLLASAFASAIVAAMGHYLDGRLPGTHLIMQAIDLSASFGIITLLFTLIFKTVPDAPTPWRGAWAGGAFTALLFIAGKIVIGIYLGHVGVASAYGAAGSLVALLIWIYYSAQILFFGAEFTYSYSQRLKT